MRRIQVFLTVFLAAITVPAIAHADPLSAFVVGTMMGLTGTAAAVATFVVNAALYSAGACSLHAAFGPKTEDGDQ